MSEGRPRPPDLAGLVVLILAAAVGLSMVIAVADLALRNPNLAEPQLVSDVLSTVFGASIGVIATFIGLRGKDGDR